MYNDEQIRSIRSSRVNRLYEIRGNLARWLIDDEEELKRNSKVLQSLRLYIEYLEKKLGE